MIAAAERPERIRGSLLGRASPVLTLVVAVAWVLAVVTTTEPGPPVVAAIVALAVALGGAGIPARTLLRSAAPLMLAVSSVVIFNTLLAAANSDPAARVILAAGPLRVTEPALATGLALGLRVIAMIAIGVTWGLSTDPTHLADALVQQARLPARFAYGVLASLQAIPWIADDLAALREARRMRGLRSSWHPRVLVALLVLAIRRAERLAVAMDARGFSSPGRTQYRLVRWRQEDGVVAAAGAVVLVLLVAVR